ncbi:MAG: glutathione synthase [Alphaproteobacteria bacterium]|nr:glutathione synthase [Alphaproteobacteria bacterium]MCB9796363.1 glutathione synthase [Alphaproteobacteria bacterium]
MRPLTDAQRATAVDLALAHGLIQRDERGEVVHAPLTLTPCPLPLDTLAALEAQIQPWNTLTHRVASDLDFLQDALARVRASDAFIADLFDMARAKEEAQPWRLLLTRSDYFLQNEPGRIGPRLCHVEQNTIAASYPGLAGKMADFHRTWLGLQPPAGVLVPNAPAQDMAQAIADTVRRYDHPRGVVLMIVQAGERNVFDQRILEKELAERGVRSLRLTLDQLRAQGQLHEGHLSVGEDIAAVTYFRAGYGPGDLDNADALAARRLIEHSSTVSVPDLATQLAGTKKVQQLLTVPAVLRRFVSEEEALVLESAYMGMHELDTPLPPAGMAAMQMAMLQPERWVLKPQREGGGNNHYDAGMVEVLATLPPESRSAYVLMERIRPVSRQAALLNRGKELQAEVVSEIGWFGTLFAEGPDILRNEPSGYLVRTRPVDATESGVSAGYGHLDSLIVVD